MLMLSVKIQDIETPGNPKWSKTLLFTYSQNLKLKASAKDLLEMGA